MTTPKEVVEASAESRKDCLEQFSHVMDLEREDVTSGTLAAVAPLLFSAVGLLETLVLQVETLTQAVERLADPPPEPVALTTDRTLSPEDAARIRDDWARLHDDGARLIRPRQGDALIVECDRHLDAETLSDTQERLERVMKRWGLEPRALILSSGLRLRGLDRYRFEPGTTRDVDGHTITDVEHDRRDGVPRPRCDRCDGSGVEPGSTSGDCTRCNGWGFIRDDEPGR